MAGCEIKTVPYHGTPAGGRCRASAVPDLTTTMLTGLKRIIQSAKVQMLAIAAFGAVVTYFLTPGTAAEKRELAKTMIMTLGALVGAVIVGWAYEDGQLKSSPQSQVNVGSDVHNPPQQPPDEDADKKP